jgi:hypothetical protein
LRAYLSPDLVKKLAIDPEFTFFAIFILAKDAGLQMAALTLLLKNRIISPAYFPDLVNLIDN